MAGLGEHEENAQTVVEDPPQDTPVPAPAEEEKPERPYSIYSTREKWFIVAIASVAGIFSPLTANIYFPAIPTIANAFHKSVELINLTVTVYMVLQGVSPMFWGTLADRTGRRPIFLACLLTLCLACIGIALTPTSDYWLLMLLRCLQAAGSASTIALGAGVIGDIATPSERGGFFGLYSLGPMVGPCLGPVLGGALADSLGWRSIFWFLCIGSAVCFASMLAFLPETLRSLVGDGSIVPSAIYRPWIPLVGQGRKDSSVSRPPPRPFTNPLRLFIHLDVLTLLIFNAIVYAVFYAITTTISTLFIEVYPFLNETDVGLCFLAVGGGMLIGSVMTGKLLDHDYKRIKERMIKRAEANPENCLKPEDAVKEEHFPIERARLRTMPVYLGIFIVCCAGYGWCLQERANLGVTLVLQIIIGYTVVSVMNIIQTLLVDLMPSQSSSVTACNNLVRCTTGAVLVSVIDLILNALRPGWTYVLLAGVCLVTAPLIWVAMWIGPKCRAKRRARTVS
ncbi:MFS general substrate transporter [Leucogyrophana mollusca]|uniref:MFS general substrate transporter n=1 Tax=Leucogyrophana mollusca TaxID=85980 RepID=A0ACB8BWU7_9AGAM|nr:MFS general substrate transporter [Leucogyrophana mollusca]